MDDKNMMFLEAMSGLDPVLISEAADKPSTHRTRLVRRISPMAAVAAVLAAIAVSAGSAYAVSVYVEDRARSKQTIATNEYKKQREAAGIDHGFADNEFITHYSDNATAEVYDQTPFEAIVTENEHIRLTVETCLADEYIVTGIMTIEGLDDEGKSYIRRDLALTDEEFAQQLDDPGFSTCFPWLTVRDEDGKWLTTVTPTMQMPCSAQRTARPPLPTACKRISCPKASEAEQPISCSLTTPQWGTAAPTASAEASLRA